MIVYALIGLALSANIYIYGKKFGLFGAPEYIL